MRPVSGEDLVTAALQSSLARAQKNYKLSNRKHLAGQRSSVLGDRNQVVKKSKELKFQSEFDLWIEQAKGITFTAEGFTNGATIPDDIECLNKDRVVETKQSQILKNPVEPVLYTKIYSENTSGDEKGKRKGKSVVELVTENSFEVLKKLKENRKDKKKLTKLRKKLINQGRSIEEAEELIQQARKGGAGAIQKLQQASLTLNSLKVNENLITNNLKQKTSPKKKATMKDLLENGESPSPRLAPATPPANARVASPSASASAVTNGGNVSNNQGHQLPQPKRILYAREKIIPGYLEKMPIGAGFYNMGNSCYLNASLQAVFHIPAFVNWIKQDSEHRRHCQDNLTCIICAMKKTLDSATSRQNTPPNNSAIRPVEIINRLRSICRHFSHGRQEDAHEFLRYLFESMERSYLTAINCLRLDNRSKETNPLGQIFGGYLRTEVTCLRCNYVSTTFQPTAELQLDIRHVTTLEDALLNHFKKERLDNNDYKCEKCRTISQATKQFSLEIPPIVLCLQLKRFTLYGTKIAKRIHCNRQLNMSKYMHKSKQVNGCTDLKYRLVALVTHLGSSPNCGHYTAIAEASNGNFYQFDDSYVHQVTVANALNNDAYVIIYEMDKRSSKSESNTLSYSSTNSLGYPSSTITSSSSTSTMSTNTIFQKKLPTIPKVQPTQSKLVNNSENEPKQVVSNGNLSSPSVAVNGNDNNSNSSGIRGLGMDRKLISFGIRNQSVGSLAPPKKLTISKPGTALTNSSKSSLSFSKSSNGGSPASTSTSVNGKEDNKSDQNVKLVPYYDDENDESDKDDTRTSSSNKRLKSPDKQFVANRTVLPVTPPKSPKHAADSVSSSTSTLTTTENHVANRISHKTQEQSTEISAKSENSNHKDRVKRKATSEIETPRKSGPRLRRSSSSSSRGSDTSSTTNSPNSRKGSECKRLREDTSIQSERKPPQSTECRRERDDRDSCSQERDRERRRDRNPSRSRSPSFDRNNEKRSSSIEHRRAESSKRNSTGTEKFDASRLKHENLIVGWDGRNSFLLRSMEEDKKRSNEINDDDDYNDEFDQGRTKKIRRSRSLPRESEGGIGNRFQIVDERKKQVEAWSTIMGGTKRSSSNGTSVDSSKSCPSDDSASKHRRSFPPRPNSSSSNGPRHFSQHSNSNNYARSRGRSPYRNGHHNGNGRNSYRSHHYNYNGNNNNKHWSNNNDRSRH